MSDKMREEFEIWALAEAEKRSYKHMDSLLKLSPIDDGYLTTWADCAWIGWQASRAVLVVGLPANCKGMAITVDELRTMLGDIGVTLK